MPGREQVVIVGCGFGGLSAARQLAGKPVDVTIVDRHNHHTFQPLLYQVATASLEPQAIAHSVRGIFRRHDNIGFRLAHAVGVDWDRRLVHVDDGEPIGFDRLVLAAGATPNTLGINGVREYTFPLKTLDDATNLRDHLLTTLERVTVHPEMADEGALTFVIVGAGPTGVELSGALAELVDQMVAADFPEIDTDRVRIVLVEALPHVLDAYSEPSRNYTQDALSSRGIEVLVDAPLEQVTADGVRLADGRQIPAATVVWAAGVRAQTLADELGVEQAKAGRIVVNDDLSLPGHREAYAIGDIAGATDRDGDLYPQLAPVAMQQGEHVARQIARTRAGLPGEPFVYTDKGIMATIGRRSAVAELASGLKLRGTVAWLAWLGAHLLFLIGFRNRAVVLLNWLYRYLTHQRASRLIVRGARQPRRTPGENADATTGETPSPDGAPMAHGQRDHGLGPQATADGRTLADAGLTGAERTDR